MIYKTYLLGFPYRGLHLGLLLFIIAQHPTVPLSFPSTPPAFIHGPWPQRPPLSPVVSVKYAVCGPTGPFSWK